MASGSQLCACWLPSRELNLLFSYLINMYWVYASPVQAMGMQWFYKCKWSPPPGGRVRFRGGRNVNHIVTQSNVNLDRGKLYGGEIPVLHTKAYSGNLI